MSAAAPRKSSLASHQSTAIASTTASVPIFIKAISAASMSESSSECRRRIRIGTADSNRIWPASLMISGSNHFIKRLRLGRAFSLEQAQDQVFSFLGKPSKRLDDSGGIPILIGRYVAIPHRPAAKHFECLPTFLPPPARHFESFVEWATEFSRKGRQAINLRLPFSEQVQWCGKDDQAQCKPEIVGGDRRRRRNHGAVR